MLSLTERARRARAWLVLLATISLVLGALVVAAPALAQDPPGNNGTIKVHDNNPGEPDPEVKNQPHVCEFDLHFFFADADQRGDWWIESWPPTGDRSVVLSSDTEGRYMTDANGEDRKPDDPNAYYSLENGHYKLFWEGATNPGGQQNIKHKVFWVDCPVAEAELGEAQILKVDQDGTGLPGAIFTLTGVTDTTFSATATTDASGSAAFSGLVEGTYSLVETTPPAGCTGFTGSITLTVDAEGDIAFGTLPTGVTVVDGTLRVVNNCGGEVTNLANLPLLKVDAAGAGRAGAVFTLTGSAGFSATATTTSSGAASFSSLEAGTYTLVETTAPPGCTGITGSITITVTGTTVSAGTLPSGVTFMDGTLRIVNNCAGGNLPTGGGPVGGQPVRQGTLAGGGAPAVGVLPTTALPLESTASVPWALAATLTLSALGVAGAATLAKVRSRR